MRFWHKIRFMNKWVCIWILVLLFLLGNFLILKPWSRKQNAANGRPTERGDSLASNYLESRHTELVKEYSLLTAQKENVRNTHIVEKNQDESTGLGKQASKDIRIRATAARNLQYRTAVLVIACNRPTVTRCIDQILKYKPTNVDIPVIVSQDCGDKPTEDAILAYGTQVQLLKQPDLSDVQGVPGNMLHYMGYYKVSRHYKWALTQAFKDATIDSVIIIEDDLDIAPDLFEYFVATRPLLDMDESIWCVSAWNDNGKEGFVKENSLLYRTDFFPGLGWMITRKIWQELEPKWPKGFWDDWMRNPDQRKGRSCLRPEISRTKTFGRIGVSQGQFYDQYLKFIKLNTEFFPFAKTDLQYLLKVNYDKDFFHDVYSKPLLNSDTVLTGSFQHPAVRISYSSDSEVESLTRQFGLMTDLKAGVPRTAYHGIISFIRNDKRIYLTPNKGWTSYNDS